VRKLSKRKRKSARRENLKSKLLRKRKTRKKLNAGPKNWRKTNKNS
jgi:hypothetical protein